MFLKPKVLYSLFLILLSWNLMAGNCRNNDCDGHLNPGIGGEEICSKCGHSDTTERKVDAAVDNMFARLIQYIPTSESQVFGEYPRPELLNWLERFRAEDKNQRSQELNEGKENLSRRTQTALSLFHQFQENNSPQTQGVTVHIMPITAWDKTTPIVLAFGRMFETGGQAVSPAFFALAYIAHNREDINTTDSSTLQEFMTACVHFSIEVVKEEVVTGMRDIRNFIREQMSGDVIEPPASLYRDEVTPISDIMDHLSDENYEGGFYNIEVNKEHIRIFISRTTTGTVNLVASMHGNLIYQLPAKHLPAFISFLFPRSEDTPRQRDSRPSVLSTIITTALAIPSFFWGIFHRNSGK